VAAETLGGEERGEGAPLRVSAWGGANTEKTGGLLSIVMKELKKLAPSRISQRQSPIQGTSRGNARGE